MTKLSSVNVEMIAYIAVFGAIFYVASLVLSKAQLGDWTKSFGKTLKGFPKPVMMALMAIPEQTVLAMYEPKMPIVNRLMISVAMYVIHFSYNGMKKVSKSYNEIPWIIGTSYYAYLAMGVKKETAIALIAADSVMTLVMRGL